MDDSSEIGMSLKISSDCDSYDSYQPFCSIMRAFGGVPVVLWNQSCIYKKRF